jgi:predicted MFS family arabinose efflux permease
MAGFYLIARTYPGHRFATLSSLLLGLGSLGDPLSGAPLALATASFGWRPTMLAIAGVAALSALCVLVVLRDPPRATPAGSSRFGGLVQILRMRELWPLLPLALVSYAAVISTRGLWITPYLAGVHGFGASEASLAATALGLAMAAGALLYAPLNRLFGNAKRTVIFGVTVAVAGWLTLGLIGDRSSAFALAVLILLGSVGAPFAIVMAHARSFLPTHLLGQGVTVLNLAFMGGPGFTQWLSGLYVRGAELAGVPESAIFGRLFLAFGLALAAALAIYTVSPPERREAA